MIFILEHGRALGALLGLAVGDTFGAPLENHPPPPVPVTDMPRRGMYTDDTLQALAVACSLVVSRGFSPEDLIVRLLEGFRKYPQYYGPTSTAVFTLILSGVPPTEAPTRVHSAQGGSRSNGSVMRGPPLGIFTASPHLEELSSACSRLTHCDPVAGACSGFMNRMVSDLVRGASREEAFRHACSTCGSVEVLGYLESFRDHPWEPSFDALLATHCALSAFMNSESFPTAVIHAVNLGGDADTIGALTGALSGAQWGVEAIPILWRERTWDHDRILLVAEDLYWVAMVKGG